MIVDVRVDVDAGPEDDHESARELMYEALRADVVVLTAGGVQFPVRAYKVLS